MQAPLELAFHELEPSEFVEAHIRDRVEALDQFHDRITSCRVTVEAPHKSGDRVTQFRVRALVHVPGSDIVGESKPSRDDDGRMDVYFAIDDAFEAVERQLKRLSEKVQARPPREPSPMEGVVASLNREDGSGLIESLDGRELYFTDDDVRNAELASLTEGESVEFMATQSSSPCPRVDYVQA